MKKFIAIMATIGIFLTLTSCAGLPAGSQPAFDIAVTIARAAARIELTAYLQKRGMSPADTQAVMTSLHSVADDLLAGKNLQEILFDQARWTPLRADAVKRLSAVLSTAKVQGVNVVDPRTAEMLSTQLVDTFAAAAKAQLGRPKPVVAPPLPVPPAH